MDAPDVVDRAGGPRAESSPTLLSGRQALVQLPILQRQLDRQAGLNTAGLISGYRGSPLGSYDMELWNCRALLEANDIRFQPGLNEDLALTALAGSQQIELLPGAKVDGVFGLWYGKGPGVDRSGDAIKHANLAGVSRSGGVVLAFGDDHAAKSSTTAHQSDLTLASWGVPVLYPSSVAEIIELGLAAFAMSRFSGLLVGLKLVNETAEATGVVDLERLPQFVAPDLPGPEGGVNFRREMIAMAAQEQRLTRHKLPRALAFAHANRLDRITFGVQRPQFLIATAGKAYGEVLAALELLGVDETRARQIGLGVYKVALVFPLDPAGLTAAAADAEEVVFVEEKQPHLESQAKALFYNRPVRPRIAGKTAPDGAPLLPSDGVLNGRLVAAALAERLEAVFAKGDVLGAGFTAAADRARASLTGPGQGAPPAFRRPAFCPGCPHNTSTQVPEGAFGATGIGCHAMAVFHPERSPLPMGHMGAEGAQWIGMAPFTETGHIFQNLGDGTYNHSGSLAIRAAVQAGVNITYKILVNDAVAMTGGQPVEGALTAGRIARQVLAEGAVRVVVVAEDPQATAAMDPLPAGAELRHRDELRLVQEALQRTPGVTALIYDQVCAAEKRRRRKAKAYPDPPVRVFINAAVCEGCGDCSVQSNCVAIQPLETELGRKRRIDQSACNKDTSCLKGFCPSFVTVEGRPRRSVVVAEETSELGEPQVPAIGDGFDMVIAGVGGTGVVTVSSILGRAAQLEGLGVSLYDSTGLSQKGGQVFSHVRIRPQPGMVVPAQVGPGQADVLLACDMVAGVQPEALQTVARGTTRVFANSDTVATADFQQRRDLAIPQAAMTERLSQAAGAAPRAIAASRLAESLFGDSIGANILMLGYAWQAGAIPLSRSSIEQAIQVNGKVAATNLNAFAAGRRAALETLQTQPEPISLANFVEARAADLAHYWKPAYGQRYLDLMDAVRASSAGVAGGDAFAWAVARSAFKLMAYKDEYEVARLYREPGFRQALESEFQDIRKLRLHLAPPILARPDPRTGRPRKMAFGNWIWPVLAVLSAARRLRETPLDLFAHTSERRLERSLRDAYLKAAAVLAGGLSEKTLPAAVELAEAPLNVRGFGPVKTPAARALLARLSEHALR